MIARWYHRRFEIFLATQVAILFGSLVVPAAFFETVLEPVLFLLNLAAGVLLLSRKPPMMWFGIAVLALSTLIFALSASGEPDSEGLGLVRMAGYFSFYLLVAVEIIKQVWRAKKVGRNVIYGLTSGYICLGLIGFFICLSIELVHPGSFQGLVAENSGTSTGALTEQLMYFSFITLMTIGYGDILPITALAQKAAMFIGLAGQFYLVIITAVVVGKFLQQRTEAQ
ncbi:Ion channel [Robiginitalea myxolifaciens]|uniref:Ion channel n=1 Tax=Robiginitalea myxolifaciens TaxID=400055 RepID=A0A1I6HKL1_9FLAO|nr:potassium channel family protein [Robiginitalea myxolifaciens]SFR54914.1 Ion channel [Robiginitalea myxolifaciens]